MEKERDSKEKDVDVLFIEDSLDDSELTEFAISQANNNLHLRHFKDGEEALNFMFGKKKYAGQKIHSEIKLVILDLGLPTLDGLEVLNIIKMDRATNKVPVVILSASRDQHDIEVAYHLGANSYVVKPNGYESYVQKIGSLAYYWSSVNERPY